MDFEKINYKDKGITWDKIIDYIDFVVRNSYDKDGNYHEYMKDYALVSAVLAMYTDYDGNISFDDAIKFRHSDKWIELTNESGVSFSVFSYYIEKEIDFANTPLRFANVALAKATVAISNLNNILQAIDIDALKNYDFSKIVNAIDALDVASNKDE